jgi:molybdate/tungstate transport system ATP-binding protein
MILVQNLHVAVGGFRLAGVSFEIPAGEYGVLMGQTGSGKTTLLETVCGLKRPTSGKVHLAGRDATWLPAAERGVGYVPQDGALFSTMTVGEHLAFALVIRKRPRDQIAARVEELADLLGISPLLGRYPKGLSGGEAQRVALGRALSAGPSVLCLDEPLSALDEETRRQMCGLLKRVQAHTRATVLHVTHNSAEAHLLGDRVLVIERGQVRAAETSEVDVARV